MDKEQAIAMLAFIADLYRIANTPPSSELTEESNNGTVRLQKEKEPV